MNIRMINQVVEWERRIEMENEKQVNLRPKMDIYISDDHKSHSKEHKSSLARIFKLNRDFNFANHSSKPA